MINAYSVFITKSTTDTLYMNFILPVACIEENSTYFLSQPTSVSFCEKMIVEDESDFDEKDLINTCNELNNEEDKDICLLMSEFYIKRINDCSDYMLSLDYSKTKESSVSNEELKIVCDKL